MMHYCLDKEELRQFLDFETNKKAVYIDGLEVWIDYAHSWQVELGCINYLLSQILERKAKDGEDCYKITELVYALENQLFFRIHECDPCLVDYMTRRLRQPSSSLEEELVMLHNNMCEHIYE